MALPQGINFRDTLAYVTDGTNEDPELSNGAVTYPRTTAQGNTVGWETSQGSQLQSRNRNASNDRRLAGKHYCQVNGVVDYRIDLPSSGDYNIKVAMGEASYSQTVDTELFDTSSSLGVLTSGSTGAANSFKDATNSTYTAANWPGSNTAASKTFSTTICRFRMSTASTQTACVAHLYVEAVAAASGQPTMDRFGGVPGMRARSIFGRSW